MRLAVTHHFELNDLVAKTENILETVWHDDCCIKYCIVNMVTNQLT